ncbi:MAG TPA: hypothetical protein VNM92_13905, partial [Thermoanaerobaculia bacterium]|nr:hypothetical protein [Thermoanaerobaculia bacterium]
TSLFSKDWRDFHAPLPASLRSLPSPRRGEGLRRFAAQRRQTVNRCHQKRLHGKIAATERKRRDVVGNAG